MTRACLDLYPKNVLLGHWRTKMQLAYIHIGPRSVDFSGGNATDVPKSMGWNKKSYFVLMSLSLAVYHLSLP